MHPEDERLKDLILAGVVGWSFPQYWMNADTLHECIDKILEATAEEILPWEM
jgi:hypothetical protein